jgi:hypothetical protein
MAFFCARTAITHHDFVFANISEILAKLVSFSNAEESVGIHLIVS